MCEGERVMVECTQWYAVNNTKEQDERYIFFTKSPISHKHKGIFYWNKNQIFEFSLNFTRIHHIVHIDHILKMSVNTV